MIQVIEKNEGTKLDYEVVGTKLFLGDDEIMVNLAKYEKDEPVHIDVVRNWDGALATSPMMICPMQRRSTFPPAPTPRKWKRCRPWMARAKWSRPRRSP